MTRVATLSLLIAVLASHVANACSCAAPPPPKEALAQADAVFVGKVTEVKEDGKFTVAATIEVESAWKGIKGKTAIVHTASQGSLCGFSFQVGKSYVICTREWPVRRAKQRPLSTNICTRTRLFDGGRTRARLKRWASR